MRTGKTTHGVKLSYRDVNGVSIPISVEFADQTRKISVGAGYNTQLKDKIALSVGAAIGNLQLDEQDFTDHEKLSITTGLLQSEINFELSKRFSTGAQIDIDLLNGVKSSHYNDGKNYPELLNTTHQYAGKDEGGRDQWYSNYNSEPFYADYNSRQDFDAAADLNRNMRSMSSFSLSLKINLFK